MRNTNAYQTNQNTLRFIIKWVTRKSKCCMKSKNALTLIGSLFKVFLPYITYDTVFDNTRAVTETGIAPVPFTEYGAPLYAFAKKNNYEYPYLPFPARAEAAE